MAMKLCRVWKMPMNVWLGLCTPELSISERSKGEGEKICEILIKFA